MVEQTGLARAISPSLARPTTIQINVTENVKLEALHTVIEQITKLTGCPTCGLLGIDLQFRGDPELGSIRNLPGVTGVNLVR